MIFVCLILALLCIFLLIKQLKLKSEIKRMAAQLTEKPESALSADSACGEPQVFSAEMGAADSGKASMGENHRLFGGLSGESGLRKLTIDNFDGDICRLAAAINSLIEEISLVKRKYYEDTDSLKKIISGISHDFRTPLTASLGYLQMLEKEQELSEDAKEYIRIIKDKTLLLKEYSDDFFEITKLQNRDYEIKHEHVNISRLVSDNIIAQNEWIEERGIKCDFDIEEGISADCSGAHFERILENLMTNACKYTRGFLKIRLEGVKEEKSSFEKKTGSASESGIGNVNGAGHRGFCLIIENDTELCFEGPEELKRVFDPFYRSVSRTTSGTGLGLYVVRLLAERMGMKAYAGLEDRNGMKVFRITLKG